MGEPIQHKRETIHWRETQGKGGNPFNLNPRYHMLLPCGVTIMRTFKTPGRAYGREKDREFLDVLYDRDYVIEWLLSRVIGCFPNITHVEMRELFTEALKLRKAREEAEKSASK